MKKRLLSLFLVFVMVLGMLPTTAFAVEMDTAPAGTVYLSVSKDGRYIDDQNGTPMASVPVDMDALAAIDLTAYGLGEGAADDYRYDADGDGEYEITALHLSIYAHENLYGGSWYEVSFTGSPGSSYFQGGVFGFDENLNYYVNGQYPLASTGWGATSDQIVIENGDFVDIASYTSWSFYSDPNAGFHYFMDGESITHTYAATAGETLTVTLGRAAQGGDYTTVLIPESSDSYWDGSYNPLPVYYGSTLYADDAQTAEIDQNGQANITFSEAGTYYLWADGGCGSADDNYDGYPDVVSSPAYAKVTVTAPACDHAWQDATCTTPKTCSNCGETEGAVDPEAHSYKDGECEYCEQAEPVSYPFTLSVGGEELTVTDLGTTECTANDKQVKAVSVTVPAGTTAVTLKSVNGMLAASVNHDAMVYVYENSSEEVSVSAGTCLCTLAMTDFTVYHIAIEVAPCENHAWQDATCTTPKTCSNCGETEGAVDPEAHSYVDGTCEYCGAAEPVSYPFILSIGGEELTITDLGTTVQCTKMYYTAKQMKVTVPAGTTTVVVNGVSGAVTIFPNHGSQKNASPGSNTEVSVATGTYLCMRDIIGGGWYHVAIEFAPCTHETWTPATCTTPKTCANCGETEGEADPEAHSYKDGKCEYCEQAEPVATPSYTIKLSEAEELTAGLNYFISVPAEVLGKDIIFDFGSGTIKGAMCQRHCSKRDIWTAGEGSTMIIAADKVSAHLCNESQRAKVASDFNLYLTEGSQMFAFYWWTSANMNGSYIYIEILPVEEECAHETWNPATCTTPKTCANCGETEGEADPEAHSYKDGKCEYCGGAEPVATPSYTIKLSEAEELTAGLNYFISVPAEFLGKDIIFDFGSGTIKGAMCQRHCSKRDIWTAGEGSTMLIAADKVADHLCNESQRAKVASDFNLYLTEGSQMFAFYWWTSANMNGSYIYIEFLPVEGGGDEDATYTVTLPTNNVGFSVRATSSPTVTAGGEFSFKLNIYDDYKKGENFKVLANGVELTSSGDTYTITNITANQTVTVEGVVEKTLAEKNVTVNAPAGSVVSSGLFHSYFKYDFVDVLEVTTLDDGRVQYIVPAAPGGDAFIRVQHPDGVTYWDFGDLNVGKIFNITEEMLYIGSTEYTKDTVFTNYEKNGHDTASLYLTANAQGWLDMDTGDVHSLNVFRNWIPVSNSTSNTGVSLPDAHYTVIAPDGTPSDVVTVTPDANNSCYADIKAEKAGTAIILVTYDAVYNADGEGGKQFSAIWPENTGVIVVTVDADDTNIQTNITVNEEANAGGKQILDVEHDILFYVGNAGAEYSFKPEDGCTVTVARSTVADEMSFNGFTAEGITVAEDGTVTLSGLTTGAHIVKVEKDGKTAYQVIRAREVSYKLTHSDGTEVTAENPAQPGETITVQFSKLIDPMGKLSGVYNAKYGFRYVDEAGTVISIKSSSGYGEYYFGSNPVRQRFSVTVPAEWDSTTYTLTDGGIALDGWGGSFGSHRSTTYMEGKEPNLNASGTAGVASVLPDVVIPVCVESTPATYTVTLPVGTGYTAAASGESASPVTEGGSYSFTVTIAEGYEAGETFAVKANGTTLAAVEGIYTIENITVDQVITVEGVVEKQTPPTPTWQEVMAKTQAYLTAQAENKTPIVGTNKGEWMVLGLARNGVTADFIDAYYENVKTYVSANIDENGRLHANKSTDNSRVILGLTAIGKDVTDVAGYDLLKGLSDLNYVKTQGINGPVFALIALDSKDYPTADNATATREALVEYILSKQLTGGGWALDGRNIDDMTPMTIQALAPYYSSNEAVKTAVNKALTVMETMNATPETYAQMIVALSALGIDCETDERFTNVLDNMLLFALEDGSFEKGKGSGSNQMSTEQCFYALVAYNRFKNGQTALYDMSDLKALHAVEILPCENGTVTVSKTSAMAGETITVTVTPDLGYQISKLTMNDAELTVTNNQAAFTMPNGIAIVEATFVKAEASAQAVAQAMTDLEVKDADEETYDAIEDIKKAYSKLTAAEKLEIADEYRAFQNKIKQYEAYLKAYINDAVDELEEFYDDLDEDDYSKKAWKKIEDLYDEALEAVKAARFEEEVYELLEEYLEDLEEAAAGELEVTFRLIGDWKHDDGVSGHDEYVTWIETTEYNMPAGSTVYDLFVKAIDDFDLNQKGASKNYVESIQAPDILGGYWIGEFDNGQNSGWMYTINGDHPGYGLKEQDLADGDEVIWHYVDDYTLEERKTTSKYYERWLEADDISPETWVKRNLDKIVTIEGKGEVKPELKTSHIGKDVKFTFTPAEGWVIKTVYVDGKNMGVIETYTYKDLAMDARIEVVFAQNVPFQMNFVDVPEAEWFYDDVYFAVSNGLFNGIDEVTFAPGASMTRAMLVTVLYRLEGQPAVYGGSAFTDMAAGQWYTDAVIWATRNGIVNGLGNGKFGSNDNVTREQMAAILYRYAQNCGYDTTARADLSGYTDAANISAYAQEAMSWANAMGLVNGRTATSLAPTGTATRAEVAAIFHRFVENIVK